MTESFAKEIEDCRRRLHTRFGRNPTNEFVVQISPRDGITALSVKDMVEDHAARCLVVKTDVAQLSQKLDNLVDLVGSMLEVFSSAAHTGNAANPMALALKVLGIDKDRMMCDDAARRILQAREALSCYPSMSLFDVACLQDRQQN